MSWSVAARIARREFRGGLKGFRLLVACLILGVAAIAGVGSVRESIAAGLARDGASLLGGDAEVQLTYRFAEERERAWLDDIALAVSEVVEFRSMAVTGGDDPKRLLTQVKAVDDAYPLLGDVPLDPPMPLALALDGAGGLPGIVVAPELMTRLRAEPGDRVSLGAQEFVVMAAIEREPDAVGTGFAIGPRSIVRTEALAESGLIKAGTLFETAYRLLLPPDADLDRLREAAREEISGARWRDRRNGAPGVAEFAERLSAFLMLVGLAGLAVGGIGVSTAVATFLEGRIATIGTLKTLGATSGTILRIYLLQIGALVALGVVIGVALGAAIPIIFAPLIEAALPVPAVFRLWPGPLTEAALFGVLTGAIFALWPLARTERVRAASLFRTRAAPLTGWPRPVWIAVTFLLATTLVVVAAWRSEMWRLTFWAAAGVLVAFCVLLIVAWGLRVLSRRLSARLRGGGAFRLALGGLGAPSGEVGSVVLSLGLGLSVLAAIGQIDWNLRSAIERDLPDVAPSFFMIDIQPDQIEPFLGGLNARDSVTRIDYAPMLRGIITQINGQPAREVAGPHWTLEGDRGVTYSQTRPEDAIIDEGEWWPDDYEGPPLVSFATEEGAELGLSLGDRITVNILGRDIEARIANFREVDFSNAGIGFIMSMNPGALRGAPHSFIATVYADESDEAAILDSVASQFPNVTAVSVRDAISRVSELLAGIAAAITWGALATLVTGVVVILGAAAGAVRARTFEAAVLKTLGASRARILGVFAIRSALMGAAAGLVAILAGATAAWAVMTFVMETEFVFEPVSAVAIVTGGALATLLGGLAFVWGPLGARPAGVLRSAD